MNKKKNLPQVDILIITYNQENYISEAISSAVNQTYKNTKVIVADDFSTDNTRLIIDKWAEQYPDKITKVYNKSNLGITGNSNAGLDYITGTFLIYMGGDDVLYPKKVETQVEWFHQNPKASLCGHSLDLINENSEKIGIQSSPNKSKGKGAFHWIRHGMLFGCMSIMIKMDPTVDLKLDHRLYYSADLKFYIDFLGKNKEFGFIKQFLGAYRKTSTSITSSNFESCMADSYKMFTILKKENVPQFKKVIERGENYLITYGYALANMKNENYQKAFKGFALTVKRDPTNIKAYLRIFQSSYFIAKEKLCIF